MKRAFVLLLVFLMTVSLAACNTKPTENDNGKSDTVAVCYNGKFEGCYEEDTGVLSFKGIPYAKSPTGERRWKAPESVDASDETYKATEFGKSAIQTICRSEDISTERSEDCLTLNIWTKDLIGKDKPVIVFFHGGSFGWGGTSEPLYTGQYIVSEHEDVVFVSCNYRVGIMGFIDFSSVPGGENYSDSGRLGLLDAVESLKWVKQNISVFGGDPDNVTILGESAGGGIVTCLLATEYAGELFHRVISESGTLNQLHTPEQAAQKDQTAVFMQIAGAETMDDLLALTEEQLITLNETPIDEDGTTINDKYSLPICGGVIPSDPYAAIANAKAKGVDLLIGTNTDEVNYWINEMGDGELDDLTTEEIEECLYYYDEYFVSPTFSRALTYISEEDQSKIYDYMNLYSDLDPVWQKTMVLHEYMFRAAAIKTAERYSESSGSGRTYMYLFGKKHSKYEFMGACHSAEMAYVFHNLNYSSFTGVIDEGLADKLCESWVNFAKTGNPCIDGLEWTEYDTTNRYTLVINNDCTLEMVSDPLSEERKLSKSFADIALGGGYGI